MLNEKTPELLDVFSKDGKVYLGKKDRKVLHANGLWHKTVHLWIRNQSGELLLQKRGPDKETHPGMWDISCAGHVGAGETTGKTAVRECREELGLAITSDDLIFLGQLFRTYRKPDNSLVDNEITDVFLLSFPVERSEVTVDGEEVSEIAFIAVDEFKRRCLIENEAIVPHEKEYQLLFNHLSETCWIN